MAATLSLEDAVRAGDLSAVEAAIDAGADVNTIPNDDDWPPLHIAIEHQAITIVRRLIAAGAEVNRDLGRGWTPLVHAIDIESDAAWQAHHETDRASNVLTSLLLAAGAGATHQAFELAEHYGNRKALTLLRQYAGHA
jgi:ankyrin repeat protein